MCKSNKVTCKNYNLDWEQKPLKILGVTFTAEVFDIWAHNVDETMHKINSLINIWSKRRLTLPGKITVIKSLILSKFTHLFLALPNPPGEFQKLLERKLFKFLWSNGPDRISRKNIVKNIQAGGLRMVNVSVFITSLKVTWIRRLLIFPDSDNWSTLSRINFNKITSMGDAYSGEVIKDLRNPFWKNILESWIQYIKSFKIDSLVKVIYSPLWGNSQMNRNRNYIINEWYNKGIRNVIDVIDENGLIYDFQTLKDRYNIHGTYLDYAQSINRIPRLWREIINENSRNIIMYRYNVQINPYIFCLLRKRRGCRDVYDNIIPVNEILVPNKWLNEVGDISGEEWKNINRNLTYIKDVKLRDFQFKINNRILVTNTFLFKIKKKETNLCSYCNQEAESIIHLLFLCDTATHFWTNLKRWLGEKANINLQIDLKNIIFSSPSQVLLSYIITVAKYYIYKCKFYKKTLSLKGFEAFLKLKFLNEMYIAKVNNRLDKFLGKWSSLYNYMITIKQTYVLQLKGICISHSSFSNRVVFWQNLFFFNQNKMMLKDISLNKSFSIKPSAH